MSIEQTIVKLLDISRIHINNVNSKYRLKVILETPIQSLAHIQSFTKQK